MKNHKRRQPHIKSVIPSWRLSHRHQPTHSGHPEPLRRHPRTHLAQTRERMRTTHRVIVILSRSLAEPTTRNSGPEDGHDLVTGVLLPQYIFRKVERNHSTSHPLFRSENTLASIEADQVLMALQQLANNNISSIYHKNIKRFSKLPKSLTTTMPTFDGKSEKLELFEDFFQMSLKNYNHLADEDRVNNCHSLMKRSALQTFKNIAGPTRENLGWIVAVFRRELIKPQSMATAKHTFQKLLFNPSNQKLLVFLDALQRLTKDAFGIAAHVSIEWFIYAKMPPHLRKSINQANLENGIYEQIVTHLEKELELSG